MLKIQYFWILINTMIKMSNSTVSVPLNLCRGRWSLDRTDPQDLWSVSSILPESSCSAPEHEVTDCLFFCLCLQGEAGSPGITGPVGPRGDPGELVRTVAPSLPLFTDVLPVPLSSSYCVDSPCLSPVRALQGGRASTGPMGSRVPQATSCSYR